MSEPRFDPNQFGGWYGAIAGGGIGILGGIIGTLVGVLIPRGKGRVWIPRLIMAVLALCALQLVFGLIALFAGQPWGIWYWPVLVGVIGVTVLGIQLPLLKRMMQARSAPPTT